LQACRVREVFIKYRLNCLITNITSRPFMASHQAIKQWFLHGTGVQLQQCKTIWHNPITPNFPLLPTLQATILACHLHHEACPDTIELTIKPLLDAKLDIVDGSRANPTL
jgi:hypothetical protein